jgi:WD40 repeat protein
MRRVVGIILLLSSLWLPSLAAQAQESPRTYSDGAFSFRYPAGWYLEESRPGMITVGNSALALADASVGSLDEGEAVIQILSPALLDLAIGTKIGPDARSEDILATLIELSNLGSSYDEVELITLNGAPAARAYMSSSSFEINTYVISLGDGHFVSFDLATYPREDAQFQTITLAIAQTMRYADPLLQTLEGHVNPASELAFSLDGTTLISVSRDRVIFWEVATGLQQQEFTLPDKFGLIQDLCLAADGTVLVAGDDNQLLRVWSAASDDIVYEWTYPPETLFTFGTAFSPDCTRIASATAVYHADTSSLTVYDLGSGQQVYQVSDTHFFEEPLVHVIYNPAGTMIAAAGRTYPIFLHDAASGDAVGEIGDPLIEAGVLSLAFSPNGSLLAVGGKSLDSAVLIWDTATGEARAVLSGQADGAQAVTFSPDGRLIAFGSGDQIVHVWDVANGTELVPIHGHETSIQSLAFSADGTLLASGDADGVIKLWDLNTALPEVSSGPAPSCMVSASQDSNLRGGPGMAYEVVGGLLAGQSGTASAQSTDADGQRWWQIDEGGWVRGDLVIATGECDALPTP